MSKRIPDEYVAAALARFTAQKPVLEEDWQELLSQMNRLVGDIAFDVQGLTSAGATALFTTTSTSYTQTNDDDIDALEEWSPVLSSARFLQPDTAAVKLEMRAFMQTCLMRITVFDLASNATIDTLELDGTLSVLPAWTTGVLDLDLSDVAAASTPTPLILYAEARAPMAMTTGSIWAWNGKEYLLRNGDETMLPDGS